MFYTSLNFSIYVRDFDPASYRLESTLLFFRSSIPVPLFPFSVRTENCLAITNTISFSSGFAVGLCKIGLF